MLRGASRPTPPGDPEDGFDGGAHRRIAAPAGGWPQQTATQLFHAALMRSHEDRGTEWANQVGKACGDLIAAFSGGANDLIAVHARLMRARKGRAGGLTEG